MKRFRILRFLPTFPFVLCRTVAPTRLRLLVISSISVAGVLPAFGAKVATPAFTPGGGTYSAVQSVTISTTTSGATIYYTTNGSTPTTSSTLYTGPVSLAATTTLKAIAVRSGYTNSSVRTATYTINLVTATPQFSVSAGTYTSPQSVAITSATAGASVYFTTDGSTPTSASSLYSGPVTIAQSSTLKAIAVKPGQADSAVASAAYTIAAAAPLYSPGGGTYTTFQSVVISSATSGASIYYTTDGSTPTIASTLYTGTPVPVNTSLTLRSIAVKAGLATSSVTSGVYSIDAIVAAPVFTPGEGYYPVPQQVAVTSATSGASIRYTTDGSTPSETYGSVYDGNPVTISPGTTLKAVAYAPLMTASAVTTGIYSGTATVATPTFSVPGGAYASARSVAVTTSTPGASIRYTTDGSVPSPTYGTVYNGADILVTNSATLKAVAYIGSVASGIASSDYVIGNQVIPPAFSPNPGTYNALSVTVALSTPTSGATIYYTTDGSVPATSSAVYTGELTISSTTTIRAMAAKAGMTGSAVTTAVFTVDKAASTPVFSPPAGTYSSAQLVSVTSSTPGVYIRYTTDGSTPTSTSGALYTGPVLISANTTLKAIAFQTGFADSGTGSAAYVVSPTNSAPALLPSGGTYAEAQSLVMYSSLAGAEIRYTLDGSDPSAVSGIPYSGPLAIGGNVTVKAVALLGGAVASGITSESYVIQSELITDTGFEGAATTSGFESFAGSWKRFPVDGITQSRMSLSSSAAHTGTQSQQLTVSRLMNGSPRLSIPIPGGIVAGRDYEASAWIKSRKRNARATLCVQNTNSWFPTNYYSAEREVGQDWTRVVLRFRASRTYANVLLAVSTAEENTLWIDDASFRPLSAADRPDPSPPGNLLRYSSFETGVAGWKSNGVVLASVDSAVTAPVHGARCGRFNWNGGSSNTLQSLGLALAWGRPYTVSFSVKSSSASLPLTFAVGSGTRNIVTQTFTTSTAWSRCVLTFIPEPTPDGIYYLSFDPPDSGTFYLDAVQVEAGDSASAYAPIAPVEAELNLSYPGRINAYYATGEAVAGTLSIFNNGVSTTLALRRRVVDLWDSPVAGSSAEWSQTVIPGRSDVPVPVLSAGDVSGAFRAECDISSDTASPYAEALFSVFRAASGGVTPCGTVLDYNLSGHSGARTGGFTWTKTWRLDWATAQPTSGSPLAFTAAQDSLINTWAGAGLRPLGILSAAPAWAQKAVAPWGWYNPSDFSLQSAYAQAAVTRYGDRVPVWELQNEPNQEVQTTSGQTRATAYALEAAALAAGAWAADPNARLLLGSLTIRDEFGPFFNEILNSQPALKALDPSTGKPRLHGVSFHFYTADPAIVRRSVAEIRSMLDAQGLGGLTIWDTEWSPIDDARSMKRAELRGLTRFSPSPRRAAALVSTGFLSRLGEGVENAVLYDTYNPGSMSSVGHKVLYELDGSFRPTVAAVSALAPVASGALAREAASWPGLWAYRMVRPDGRPVTVLWTDDALAESATVAYVTPDAVSLTDMMGNPAGSYPAGASIAIGADPVFLLGSLGAVTGLKAAPSDGGVALSWDAYPGAASYSISHGSAPGGAMATASNLSLTSTTLGGLTNGVPVYFLVTARDAAGNPLAYSIPSSATPSPAAGVRRDYWTGVTGANVSNLTGSAAFPDVPTGSDTLATLRAIQWGGAATKDWGDNYGQRLRAWIVAPETGSYTFWISGDDSTELWLSPDSSPGNRMKIAWNTAYTGQDEWSKYATQCSANNAFLFAGGAPGAVQLTAGQRYFVEVLHQENTGSDHVSVGWRKPSDGPGSNPSEIVPALTPWVAPAAVPGAPTGLTAAATSGQIGLVWNPVAGATGYTVKRSTLADSGFFSIASVTVPTFSDASPAQGASYFYRVSATGASGESADSASAQATAWSAFQTWQEAQFGEGASALVTAPAADPDDDSASNIIEYASGTDPLSGTSVALPACQANSGRLNLTFRRVADPSLSYFVEASDDLSPGSWVPIWSSTGSANTGGTVSVQDSSDLASKPRRFLRLRVNY